MEDLLFPTLEPTNQSHLKASDFFCEGNVWVGQVFDSAPAAAVPEQFLICH